jgi:hypothetical protein
MVKLWAQPMTSAKKFDLGSKWGKSTEVRELAETILELCPLPESQEIMYAYQCSISSDKYLHS